MLRENTQARTLVLKGYSKLYKDGLQQSLAEVRSVFQRENLVVKRGEHENQAELTFRARTRLFISV